jgi:glutamate racemase
MLDEKIDHLVLGCTHYPFFIPILKEILPKDIVIENPAPAVARQTARILSEVDAKPLATVKAKPFVKFFSSGETDTLEHLVKEIETTTNIEFKQKSFQHFSF